MTAKQSLRSSLLRRSLLSINVGILLVLPFIYFAFHNSAQEAYDLELSEAAYSLAAYLHVEKGIANFEMSEDAERVFRSDALNKNYFLVLAPDGHYLAGDRDLPYSAKNVVGRPSLYYFYDSEYLDEAIRVCVYRQVVGGKVYLFAAAETTTKRNQLALKILIGLILPIFMLSLFNGLGVWRVINLSLRPIDKIRQELRNLKPGEFKPLTIDTAPEEVRQLVEEFNAMLKKTEEISRAQQTFVATAAHQLRTPLAGIQTQLELICNETADAQQQVRMARCVESITRLSRLIQQMLTLISAAPGGRESAYLSYINVPEIIQDRLPEWLRMAAQKNIDLGCELLPLTILGDPLLAGELLTNVVENAVNYAPVGGVITIRSYSTTTKGVIEVEDNGPGIPVAERKRVLERFYRLPNSDLPGSGLGLSIVHEITRNLGGSIDILTPSSEQGCLVRIELPVNDS